MAVKSLKQELEAAKPASHIVSTARKKRTMNMCVQMYMEGRSHYQALFLRIFGGFWDGGLLVGPEDEQSWKAD